MKIERLEISNKKVKIAFIVGIVLTAILFIMVNYLVTKAKYRNTESLDLVKGTITYNKADLNIIAMYQESSYGTNGYKQIDDVPTEKYTLSNKSYCEVGSQKVEDAQIEYREGAIYVGNIKKRGTKCYIYFDLDYKADDMLAKLETIKQSKYEKTAMPNPITGPYDADVENPEHKEKIYTTEDNYGTSYVFRGNNDDVNNWVTFANHTWRIIRINGDGTLRLIFQCAEPNCTDTKGPTTQIGKSAYKLAPLDDNTYVGYYYGEAGQDTYDKTHTNAHPSDVAKAVDNWYTGTGNMTSYTKYLSGDTGFCNDRVVVTKVWNDYEGNGTGQSATGYGPAARLILNGGWRKSQYPTLKCGVNIGGVNKETYDNFDVDPTALKRDLFTTKNSGRGNEILTYPVGLITSDEVTMAGLFGGTAFADYWLYTNQHYWTMSPNWYDVNNKVADVFPVHENGNFYYCGVGSVHGVRPVINLNADIEFSGGTGKSDNPFIVKTSN